MIGVTGDFESYEFAVGGQDKRVLIGFVPTKGNAAVTSLTLDLSAWAGRSVSVTAYRLTNQAPLALAMAPVDVVASASTTVSFSATVADNDALLILVQAR